MELFRKNRVKNKRVDGRDSWKMIREPRQKDMGLYGGILHKLAPKKTRFAAIDIGASEIKLVEISTAEGHRVVTAYGKVATPLDNLDDLADEEVMVNALKDLVLTSGLETREVITTISADKVITRHIRLPLMPDKELEAALRFEVEKLVPAPVDELIIRYAKLDITEQNNEKIMHLLLAAVPTSYIYDFYRVFARADLTVAAIDLQALSLWRLFCGIKPEYGGKGVTGFIDIGAASTQFLVTNDGFLEFTRILPVGGNLLTQSLAEYYGYDPSEAEQLKKARGRLLSAEEVAATSEEDMKIDFSLRDGLSELVREIKRSVDFYASQERAVPIERFILSGGTVKLTGFREFMAEAMGVPVELGEPGLPGQPVEETTNEPFDPSYAVALGSALREVVE